jgi:hypothetical protein
VVDRDDREALPSSNSSNSNSSSSDGSGSSSSSGSNQEDAATLSIYSELVPPSIAKLIEREGGVEEWLVEMQVRESGQVFDCCIFGPVWVYARVVYGNSRPLNILELCNMIYHMATGVPKC